MKASLRKRIIFISVICTLILGLISLGIYGAIKPGRNSFKGSNGYYENKEASILSYKAPSSNTIDINTLYNITDNNGTVEESNSGFILEDNQIINISSALDLYAFSKLCNSSDKYLAYKYQLLSNINYNDCNYEFEPVAWKLGKSFTGTFNGNGFEVSNLDLLTISYKEEAEKQKFDDLEYFAMFSRLGNGAIVTKVGLRDTNIIINGLLPKVKGIAPLVGLIGTGAEVSYCFATDFRDPIVDEAGITAYGGYRISGLVFSNAGSLLNSYTAYSSVINYTVLDYIDFTEILMENPGTANNIHFYNSTIEAYRKNNDSFYVKYKAPISKEFNIKLYYGTYTPSLKDLNDTVLNTNKDVWYHSSSYGDLGAYLNIKTPIARGLKATKEEKGYSFLITSELDYAYIFELMNYNAIFATDKMTYKIERDLDLSSLNPKSYFYSNSIAASFIGLPQEVGSVTLANGTVSKNPTIYNPSLTNKVITEGMNVYGLFPWLTGSVNDLNVVIDDNHTASLDYIENDNNIKALGILSGYSSGAKINNVHVEGKINIDNTCGQYFVGMLSGILGGMASVSNSTATGLITSTGDNNNKYSDVRGYMHGSAVGGLVGYIDRTYGSLNKIYSNVGINALGSSKNILALGGVLGAGYIATLDGAEYGGAINVGDSGANVSHLVLYASGAIGRLLGQKEQILNINNQGDINVYAGLIDVYLSGILNADLQTSKTALDASSLKEFQAASLLNSGDIKLNTKAKNNGYTYGINILAKNGFNSIVSGVYSLAYKTSFNKSKAEHTPIDIDMSLVNSFAPNINVIGGSEGAITDIDTVYNLRDISFTASSNLTTAFNYSGVVNGEYIKYDNISNEGNMNVNFPSLVNGPDTNKRFVINGVFSELSPKMTAKNIFNGGSININSESLDLKYQIEASGITNINKSVISDETYNPLSPNFDNKTKGSIDVAINNGDIKITSLKMIDDESIDEENEHNYYNSHVMASGIANDNHGIISNSFNLGDIFIGTEGVAGMNYEAGGITHKNTGEFAQIRDSANNGIIKVISKGKKKANVFASGITVHNDLFEGQMSTNNKQVIAFTINYGETYAFSGYRELNPDGTAADYKPITANENTKSGGILASGFCNLVNTINYGNIFSVTTAGGMIASIDLHKFDTSYQTIISNTLNYGNVKAINRYKTIDGKPNYAKYGIIRELKPDTPDYISIGFISQRQAIGGLIGVADYNGMDAIKIRYLINFSKDISILALELNAPTNPSTDISTLINVSPLSKFLGKPVTYAPLSTVSDEDGNIGVFAPEFMFRQAIAGRNLDPNEVTDKYIGDFFQFVAFEKINQNILERIGWKQIAYLNASLEFARNVTDVARMFTHGVNHDNAVLNRAIEDALLTDSWLYNCDTKLLENLLTETISVGNFSNESLNEVIRFILFDTKDSPLSSKLRDEIVESVFTYINDAETAANYYDLLNTLLYDEVLAKIIGNDSPEYSSLSNDINALIDSMDEKDLEGIVGKYIENLTKNPTGPWLDPLFDPNLKDYYFAAKMRLLESLLQGYPPRVLQSLLIKIGGQNESLYARYFSYLNQNEADAQKLYIDLITNNIYDGKNKFSEAINNSFIKNNVVGEIDKIFAPENKDKAQDIKDFKAAATNYVAIWNAIKYDSEFQKYLNDNIFTNVSSVNDTTGKGIYAIATEYNNTYQSNDAPSIEGQKEGLTRQTNADGIINTRFIYTPDHLVSDKTYYYGPYKKNLDEDGNPVIFYPGSINDNYNLHLNLWVTGEVPKKQIKYVPFFATTKVDHLTNKGILKGDYQEFYWNNPASDGNQGGESWSQWVSTHIVRKQPSDGFNYLLKDDNSKPTVDGFYDFGYNDRTAIGEDEKSLTYTRDECTTSKIVDGKIEYTHKKECISNYLIGYISAGLITGIWYQHDIWPDDNGGLNGAYLTSKHQAGNYVDGYYGVHTTRYINYFLDDLLKVDGIRTKGLCATEKKKDQDEIDLIEDLMKKILSKPDNSGVEAVFKALGKVSQQGFGVDDNGVSTIDSANTLINFFKNRGFSSKTIKGLIDNDERLQLVIGKTTDEKPITLKDYLDNAVKNNEMSIKDQLIANVIDDKDAFRKLLLEIYNFSKDSFYTIPSNNLTDFAYDYLLQYGDDLVSSQKAIDNIFSSATNKDLDDVINLFTNNLIPNNTVAGGLTYLRGWKLSTGAFDLKNSGANLEATFTHKLVPVAYGNKNKSSAIKFIAAGSYLKIAYHGALGLSAPNGNNINIPSAVNGDFDYFEINTLEQGKEYTLYAIEGNVIIYDMYTAVGEAKAFDTIPYFDIPLDKQITGFSNNEYHMSSNQNNSRHIKFTIPNDFPQNAYLRFERRGQLFLKHPGIAGNEGFVDITSNSDVNEPYEIKLEPGNYELNPKNSKLEWTETYISNFRIEFSNSKEEVNYTVSHRLDDGEYKVSIKFTTSNPLGTDIEYSLGDNSKKYSLKINPISGFLLKGEWGKNLDCNVTLYKLPSKKMVDFTFAINGLASDFEAKYNALSDLSKFIVNKSGKIIPGSSKTITIKEPSMVLVQAKGAKNTKITIGDLTRTIGKGKASKYYVFVLEDVGLYEINTTAAIQKVVILSSDAGYTLTTKEGSNNNVVNFSSMYLGKLMKILDFEYSKLSTFNKDLETILLNSGISEPTVGKYQKFVQYYLLSRGDDNFGAEEMHKKDLREFVKTLYPTMHNIDNQWLIFTNKVFTNGIDGNLINIAKNVVKADYKKPNTAGENCSLDRLITSSYTDGMKLDILKKIAYSSQEILAKANIKILETNKTNEEIVKLFKSAYIGNDYIKNFENYTLKDSIIKDLILNANSKLKEYQFIDVDKEREIYNDKYALFIDYIFDGKSNLNANSYGIYALSSSKGILNGSFIPDNVALTTLDKKYDSKLELTVDSTDAWRRRGEPAQDSPKGTKDNSVNYAIKEDMKQLILSISTVIFELNLKDSSNRVHHSSESSIDLKNSVITYYVTEGYIAGLNGDLTLTIEGIPALANNAEISKKKDLVISTDGLIDAITVQAEDKTVETSYTIKFVEKAIDFKLSHKDGTREKEVLATGGELEILVTSPDPAKKLPENMDLREYIVIYVGNSLSGTKLTNLENVFRIKKIDGNCVVNSEGSALITLEILQELKGDTYTLGLDIFKVVGVENENYATFTKLAGKEANITSFVYNGEDKTAEINAGALNSTIPFGRAFDENNFTYPSNTFYLDDLVVSPGASIVVAVTIPDMTTLKNGEVMTYSVKYTITSEDGKAIKEYTHNLTEMAPFNNKDSFASVYQDGEYDGVARIFNDKADNTIVKKFERTLNPQFTIKYALNSFYLEDEGKVMFEVVEDKDNITGSAIIDIYSGMSVTAASSNEISSFIYNYVYSSSYTWGGKTLYRTYSFPAFKITRIYSTDATLKKINFIDSHIILGSSATVMDTEKVIMPNVASPKADEINYNTIIADKNREIKVEKGNIYYGNKGNSKDYFTVGTVSDAALESYNPSFTLETHAEIFRTTSKAKLSMKAGDSDKTILTNHETTYLYVPYVSGDVNQIFLVEVNAGVWENVYLSEADILKNTSINVKLELNKSFDYDGKTWTLAPFAGKPVKENYSLGTDYIGTPEENHFWYVSYVVFSEAYRYANDGLNEHKFYHIALIDNQNTVYYNITLNAPEGFLDSIFITLAYTEYKEAAGGASQSFSNQLSGYLTRKNGNKEYTLDTDLQILPNAYYDFLIDIPVGYIATATISKDNRNDKLDLHPDAYKPPSSIVTQRISINIEITKDLNATQGNWGVSIGDVGTRKVIVAKPQKQ